MRRIAIILVVFMLVFATGDISELTKSVTTVDGDTKITADIGAKAMSASKVDVISKAIDTVFKSLEYPLAIAPPVVSDTDVTIDQYECNPSTGMCYYWLSATRDGKDVFIDNPIGLFNPPYTVLVSETYDEKTDTTTTVVREDPKAALEHILQSYANRQPVVGAEPTVEPTVKLTVNPKETGIIEEPIEEIKG